MELILNINFLQENDEKSSNFDFFEILFRQILRTCVKDAATKGRSIWNNS